MRLKTNSRKILNQFTFSFTDCRETVRSKRAKRPRASSAIEFRPEPEQELDEADGNTQEKPLTIPTSFLSPSVREYLELGKSIPGKIHYHRTYYNR